MDKIILVNCLLWVDEFVMLYLAHILSYFHYHAQGITSRVHCTSYYYGVVQSSQAKLQANR